MRQRARGLGRDLHGECAPLRGVFQGEAPPCQIKDLAAPEPPPRGGRFAPAPRFGRGEHCLALSMMLHLCLNDLVGVEMATVSRDAVNYFDFVKNDLFALRIEWRLYRSLFGTNPETVDLLNRVSGPTANTLERILFERTLLGIRRLTDPPVGQRRNTQSVTVKGLVERFGSDDVELRKRVNQAESAASFARNWSAKRIAHADLQYRTGKAKLETASRAKVELAIDKIAKVVKWVSRSYFDTTLVTHPIPALNDERNFLRALYLGQLEREARKENLKALLKVGNHVEFDRLRNEPMDFPAWLLRDDPPMDVD